MAGCAYSHPVMDCPLSSRSTGVVRKGVHQLAQHPYEVPTQPTGHRGGAHRDSTYIDEQCRLARPLCHYCTIWAAATYSLAIILLC